VTALPYYISVVKLIVDMPAGSHIMKFYVSTCRET